MGLPSMGYGATSAEAVPEIQGLGQGCPDYQQAGRLPHVRRAWFS
jgi:hypothetical protein